MVNNKQKAIQAITKCEKLFDEVKVNFTKREQVKFKNELAEIKHLIKQKKGIGE